MGLSWTGGLFCLLAGNKGNRRTVSKVVIHSKYHPAKEFSRPRPNLLSPPFPKAGRWPESLTASCSCLRNPATSTPPQDRRSTGAEQCAAERSRPPPREKVCTLYNQSSRPWARPLAETHTTLQPLQLREDKLGSRHLLWRQRKTLLELLHSSSLPWVF